ATVSITVTPECATSMSLIMPNDTMSRLNPGYLTFLSSDRISLGLGIPVRVPEAGHPAPRRYQCRFAMLSFRECRKNDASGALRSRLESDRSAARVCAPREIVGSRRRRTSHNDTKSVARVGVG